MKCPQCQSENAAEAKFCGKCGAALTSTPLPPPPPPPPLEPLSPQPAVPDGLKIGIIIGSVIFPLLGIVMGLIYMNDPNPEKKKVGKLWLMVGAGAFALGCICYFAMAASTGF